jgi:hypothetical protein
MTKETRNPNAEQARNLIKVSSPLPNAGEGLGVKGLACSGIFCQAFQGSHPALGFKYFVIDSSFELRHSSFSRSGAVLSDFLTM